MMQFLRIPAQISPLRRLRVTHRILLIFVATILAPGILLSSFGTRALIQERRLADQQIHERLAAVAERAARRLELELLAWQQAADQLAQSDATNATRWPLRVRAAVEEPGSAIVLLGDKKRAQALPPGHLLYSLSPSAARPAPQPSSLLAEAESVEPFSQKSAHGGTVDFESQEGEGSAFTLHLKAGT